MFPIKFIESDNTKKVPDNTLFIIGSNMKKNLHQIQIFTKRKENCKELLQDIEMDSSLGYNEETMMIGRLDEYMRRIIKMNQGNELDGG